MSTGSISLIANITGTLPSLSSILAAGMICSWGGTIANYVGMKQRGGSALARTHQRLVIGPWSHINMTGEFAERRYGLSASREAVDLDGMQLRWYDHWLKGEDMRNAFNKPNHSGLLS
jgi:hypothetical protein